MAEFEALQPGGHANLVANIKSYVGGQVSKLAAQEEWDGIVHRVSVGDISALTVGTQISETYKRADNSNVLAMPLDVVHHGTGTLQGGGTLPVMFLQSHYALPFGTQISQYQGFLKAIDGLPAGTYNVTMGFNWGTHVVSGKSYYSTLANAVPAGGVLAGFRGAPDQAPSNWKVYVYASNTATTPTETVSVTEGSSGTSLGTFTAAGAQVVPASGTPATHSTVTINGTDYTYYGLNSLYRVAYGNNRYLHSAIRQWLNASGLNWWAPATVFDLPPDYVSYPGFLTGLSDGLVAAMRPIQQKTALNYVSDGGTDVAPEYDTSYDNVFLPSWEQHFIKPSSYFGGTAGLEGEAWDYWKAAYGSSTPPEAWSTNTQYIQYDMADHTAARTVWVRSANRNNAYSVAIVYSSGYCGNYSAIYCDRVAPACAIG